MTIPPPQSFESCGVRIDAYQPESAVDAIISTAGSDGTGRDVHLCNAYTLSLAAKDSELSDALNESDMNLPDGMPLVWISRRLGLEHMVERVYGPDLMLAVLNKGRSNGVRHYLYGATEDVLTALAKEIEQRFPGVEIVGMEAPPFREFTTTEHHKSAERIRSVKPDVVWVGLGTPKQDFAAHWLAKQVPATFVAVGAAFDFIAGNKRRAPAWMQRIGLEWAFRLLTEPRRLWRRYLIGNTVFVVRNLWKRPRLMTETPARSEGS